MVRARAVGLRVEVDPDGKEMQRRLRQADKAFARELGRVHKRLGGYPADEAKRRASAKGGGYSRLARDIRPRANQRDIRVVIGGGSFPDSVGWEFGAIRWPQFDPWTGNGDGAGYVVFALQRDAAWMDRFAVKVADDLEVFTKPLIGK